ncbi:kinase non-catalytic C-lobe domain-containing protein 1 [Tiliqua scincoides]|uniref:kinase non-catalytic C-lobe domain-containing protein 1 n=1 Tax=Tiliqua scincoides TaxID=71010 RepID=UPI0034628E96
MDDQVEENDSPNFEPLPALLEDEENVSLADVLSLWDSCLTEQDIWAICLECSQSLKSIADSAIFQTLCITPDTLAFNTNGNVCFMEQISDDPEGAFVPPEFDVTGNTFEAHIFSLGATLQAAIEYMKEPEIHSEFSQHLHNLLEEMQEKNPKERPDIESVISACKDELKLSSSSEICQRLSATGRRVLSIESCGNVQGSCDNLWNGKTYERISPCGHYTGGNSCIKDTSSLEMEDLTAAIGKNSSGLHTMNDRKYDIKEINLLNERFCSQRDATQLTECKGENGNMKHSNECMKSMLDAKPYTIELERGVLNNCLRKIKTFPKLPSESDTNPPTWFPLKMHNGLLPGKHQLIPKSLSLIGNNEHSPLEANSIKCDDDNRLGLIAECFQKPDVNLEECCLRSKISPVYQHRMLTCNDRESYFLQYSPSEISDNSTIPNSAEEPKSGPEVLGNYKAWKCCGETSPTSDESCLLQISRMTTVFTPPHENGCRSTLLRPGEQHHTEMKDYYIEDKQVGGRESEMKANEQWIFLKLLLTQYGKPLKDYELWALCYECLLTLETCADYPAYLCLDSVLINSDGSVHFTSPQSRGSCDMFYLAPELTEEYFVTEKVCIYCIAAILWRAAKYNFPPDHKLVLPRKLKNFLLDMARRKSEDRPSLTDAIKTCDSYLLEQNIHSKKVLAILTKSAFQGSKELDSFHKDFPFDFASERNAVDDNLGFLPTHNEGKLIAVKGPVPYQPSLNKESAMLPTAFTSPATHFKPIILHQNADIKKDTIVSVSQKCETTMERVVPMDSKNATLLSVDVEDQTDEDSGMPTVCMSSDILEQDQQGSKTSLHTTLKEQHPDKTSSSVTQLPLISDSLCDSREKCTSVPATSNVSHCTLSPTMAFINNFLLKQDPETRVLTLVPVQIAVSEQIPNKPLHSRAAYSCCPSLQVLLSDAVVNYSSGKTLQNTGQNECGDSKVDRNTESAMTTSKETQTMTSERNLSLPFCSEHNASLKDHTLRASVNQNPPCSFSLKTSPKNDEVNDVYLKEVVHLVQEEFAFGSYLENTAEALTMGRYIFNLKDLKYNTFCNAISEKFCDLYWEEKLLANLYDAANGRTVPSVRMNDTEFCSKDFQSMNNINGLPTSSDDTNVLIPATFAGINVHGFPQNNIEKEVGSQMVIVGKETEEKCLQTDTCYLSPDLPDGSLDQEEVLEMTEGNICAKSICPSEFHGFCPGWSTAFYGSECFDLEVHNYVRKLGKQKTWQVNGIQSTDAKGMELEQLIMIETKNYRKSMKFYRRLLHKERRNKGCEAKTMLPKLRGQLEEMKSKIQFLELVKKYLQITLMEKWGVEPCNLPTVVNMARSEPLDVNSLDGMLLFYNINKTQYKSQYNDNQNQPRNLQTGTPLGLMAYLYSRNAFLEGYVQQFLFTFRYFCTQEELLQFLLDRIRITLPSSNLGSCSLLSKIYHRSFSILQTWIEDCYTVDFTINPDLMSTLKDFIISKVALLNGYGERLLSLLEGITTRKQSNVFQCCSLEEWTEEEEGGCETKSLLTLCRKVSRDAAQKNLNWKFSKGNEAVGPSRIAKQYSIASALPKPCNAHLQEDFSNFCTKIDGGIYFLTEYTAQQLCCQLTLLEQETFHKCHPVHFLNSRLLGVNDKSAPLQKATSSELLPTQVYNLFVQKCVQDDYLLQLLKYADNVSTWVAAEIVTSYSSKVQVNLLSKFLFIAKCCYEHRNFATTVQILRGLENLIVRQLPVWKCLPSRVSEIMEELRAVEVFLKSDSLCLMEGERFKTSPTIPSAHILAMHIQQLETGGFTLRNGTYKWTKLRNIAKVVSQVHAFQENPYMFTPDHHLQSCLRHRIAHFNDADISALASDNYANFHQIPAEKHSRKIQDTLHRMKAMFQ